MVAWAFPFGWVFGRIGCALVQDHPGVWSSSWLAVQYPGGSRYDLAVLEVFLLPVLALLIVPSLPRGTYPLVITIGGVRSNAPVVTVSAAN